MPKNKTPNQWSRLLTPASLAEYGAIDKARPKDPFDPGGAWRQTWRLWLLRRNTKDVNHRGFIRLERRPSSSGKSFDLDITQTAIQVSQYAVHQMRARLRCAGDALATPVSWSIQTRLFSVTGDREFTEAAVQKKGSLTGGKLRTEAGGRTFEEDLSGPVTSNWSLFEALERLPGPEAPPLGFTLLDELDKIKPAQRLRFRQTTSIPFGGETVKVHCYQRLGEGHLPCYYYVDGNHRLLLMISELRAYILDADAERKHEEILKRLAGSRRRTS